MLFLLLTILSSLSISLLLKFNESREGERLVVAGSNYIVAGLLGIALADEMNLALPATWSVFGILVGAGFVAGFMMLMRSIRALGLAVPISVARIATLGPVVGSVIVFHEQPGLIQLIGIAIGIASFLMLGIAQRKPEKQFALDTKAIAMLGILFGVMVFNDFSMKIVQEGRVDKSAFLFYVFSAATALCWIIVWMRKLPVHRRDIVLGLVLGIPNFFSSYFLILALRDLSASVAFPIISAAGVLATTAAAILIWKERPNRAAWIGIILAALAVVLLGSE